MPKKYIINQYWVKVGIWWDKTTSITEYLSSIWEDNSFSARKKIAEDLWIENYRGTAEQNQKLLTWYQKTEESSWEAEKEVEKALSSNNLQALQEAVKKHWQDKIAKLLKDQWIYDETVARLKESVNQKNNSQWTDQSLIPTEKWDTEVFWEAFDWKTDEQKRQENTDQLVDENKAEDPLFPQYKPFEISDEERANIEETQKAYYDPFFKRETSRLTEGYNVDKLALDRLIGYSQTDTARDLAKINTTFAKTMSNASKAYWKRNILWSWIQKQQAWENTEQLWKDEYNRKEYARRQEEWYETRQANIKTKFDEGLTDINESQDAQTYFDTLKEIQNRQSEYTRQFWQSQENIDFNITKPTTPTAESYTWTDANKKVLNSNYK